jgi:uncharacterized protein (UPF0333 family)
MFRYLRNLVKKALRTGVVIGGAVTAYQAAQTTKKQGGSFKWDKFLGNFKAQASTNIKLTANAAKGLIGKYYDSYRVSDKGENGYAYKNAAPENDKVSEVFETIREYAPGVIDKVEEFVDDVRENAPEYKAKAQGFVDDVKDAAIKALELDEKDEKAEEPKQEKKAEKAEKSEEPKPEKKSVKAKKTVKEDKEEK